MKSNKKTNKLFIIAGMLIGIAIGMILIFFQFMRYILSDVIEQEYTTLNISNYGQWDGHIENERNNIGSMLAIFPSSTENVMDVNYYYSCGKYSSSCNYYIICAEMKYADEEFRKEVQRISEIKCDVYLKRDQETVTNVIQYSEELFVHPAYIAIYGSNGCYEYALINEQEKEIVYIYLQDKVGKDILPNAYLPLNYQNMGVYELNDGENVNIYYAQDSAGDYCYYDGNHQIISFK